MTGALVAASHISAGYNGQAIITDCSVVVPEGSMVGIVGRNGAGKTTLVSALSGRVPLLSGEIFMCGERIDDLPTYRRSSLGIMHVPQGREVFANLTVEENLRLADRGGDKAFVFELFPRLSDRRRQQAGTLSGGEQQMLAISRAIVAKPRLIILDEPSLGLAPVIVERLFESIARLRHETGVTMLVVEQQTRWMWQSGLLDSVYVLEQGQVVRQGTTAELAEDEVVASYLGQEGMAT